MFCSPAFNSPWVLRGGGAAARRRAAVARGSGGPVRRRRESGLAGTPCPVFRPPGLPTEVTGRAKGWRGPRNGKQTMSEAAVLFDVADHVATITFNRPENQNTISGLMLAKLSELLLESDANEDVRAIVITGTGKFFCESTEA